MFIIRVSKAICNKSRSFNSLQHMYSIEVGITVQFEDLNQLRVSCLLEVYIIFLFITVTFVIIWKFHLFYFILFIFWLSNMTKKKIIFTNFGTTTFKITISTYLEKRFSCPSEISIKKSVCLICKLFAGMITPFLCDFKNCWLCRLWFPFQ